MLVDLRNKLLMFILTALFVAISLPSQAFAAFTAGITYHGRILKPDNTPEVDPSVQFKIQIYTPGTENCLMYEERQTKDLSASLGAFSITINDGSGARVDTSGFQLDQIFANRSGSTLTFPGGTCSIGTTYNPSAADGRKFTVSFKDSTMATWEPLPAQSINFAPSAIEAYQVGGFPSSSLLRVENGAGPQNVASLTPAQAAALVALSNGSSTAYVQSGSNGASLPSFAANPASPAAGQVWYDSVGKVVKYYDGTSVQTVGSGGAVSGNSITSGTIGGSTSMNTTGTVTAASVSSTTDSTNALRLFENTNTHKVTVTVPASLAADYALQLPGAAPTTTNQFLVSSTAGVTSWSSNMVIDATGNVGIGTTAPQYPLDISRAAVASTDTLFRLTNTGTMGDNLASFAETANSSAVNVVNGGLTTWGMNLNLVSGNNDITFSAPLGSERMHISNSGNVGIGTTAPATPLEVTRDAPGTVSTVGTAVTGTGTTFLSTFKVGDSIYIYGQNRTVAAIASDTALTINSALPSNATNLGYTRAQARFDGTVEIQGSGPSANIGSPSPLDLLVLRNTSAVQPWTHGTGIRFETTNGTFAGRIATAGNGGIPNADMYFQTTGSNPAMILGQGGTVGFGSGSWSMGNGTAFDINNQMTAAAGVANGVRTRQTLTATANNDVLNGLYLNPTFTDGAFTGVTHNGLIVVSGNVGVGTTTPAGNLAIDNAGHNATLCLNGGCVSTLSAGGGSQSSNTNFVLNSNADGSGSDGGFNFQSNGSSILQVSNSGAITTYGNITGNSALAISAGGANQNLVLNSSGTGTVNVGTGNGTGLAVLDPGAGTANYVTVKGAAAGNAPVIGTAGTDANINLSLTPKGSGDVSITTGNVLIDGGTTVGAGIANLKGIYTLRTDETKPYGLYMGSSSINDWSMYMPASSPDLRFYSETAAGDVVTITGAGRVGFGTTTPYAPFQMQGSGAAVGTGAVFDNANAPILKMGSTPNAAVIGSNNWSSKPILFNINMNLNNDFSSGTSAMAIASNGNVGIGTTTPTYNVSLSGQSAQTIGMERSSLNAGSDLTISAGSAQVGSTNKKGGNLVLQAGTNTGNSATTDTAILFQVPPFNNGAATSDATPVNMAGINRYGLAIGLNAANSQYGLLQVAGYQGPHGVFIGDNATEGTPSSQHGGTIELLHGWGSGEGPVNVNSVAGDIQFSVIDSTWNHGITADISSVATNVTHGSVAGNLQFMTSNGGALSTKMLIDNAGYVGIGTITPAGNLAIDNTGHNATLCLNGGCVSTLSAGGGSQSSNTNFVLNSNADGSGSDGGFNFQSNGSSILQISNSGAITTYGNITGNSALAVSAGGANQNLVLNSSGTGTVNVGTGNGTGLAVLDPGAGSANYVTVKGAAAGNAPVIGTAGSDANINLVLIPKGTGGVGIGTTSPLNSLDVKGTSATADVNVIRAQANATSNGVYVVAENTNATSHQAGYKISYGGADRWAIQNDTSANGTDNFGIYSNNVSKVVFDISAAGNVGIGTTGPVTQLHQDAGTATASYHKFTAGTTTGQTATDGFDIGVTSAGIAEIRQYEAQSLKFYTNNTNYLTLGSSGVLQYTGSSFVQQASHNAVYASSGATTVPNIFSLSVVNDSATNGDTSGSILTVKNSSSNYQRAYFSAVSNSGAGVYTPSLVWGQQLDSGNYAERMRIDSSGRVGIGTATPGGNLAIDNAGHNATLCLNGVCSTTLGGGGGSVIYPADANGAGSSIAIGPNALQQQGSLASGNYSNIGIGLNAIGSTSMTSAAINNTAVGFIALQSNTSGHDNTALGNNALQANTTGDTNVALGANAMELNTTGYQNVAVGNAALYNNVSGFYNVAVGAGSLAGTGSQNVGVGYLAGNLLTTGTDNTFVGYDSGKNVTSGSQNIMIGSFGGVNGITTGDNNIFIGYDIKTATPTASNQLNIGNLIFGTGLGYSATLASGGVGIGTPNPHSDINGTNTALLDLTSSGTVRLSMHDTATTQEARIANNGTGMFFEVVGNATATNNVFIWRTSNTNSDFNTTERMRMDSAGKLGIGTATPATPLHVYSGTAGATAETVEGLYAAAGSVILTKWQRSGGGVAAAVRYNDASTSMEFYSPTGHSVAYNSPSDRRLKNIIGETQYGLDDVLKLDVYDYTYKSDKNSQPRTGFMAQELYKVYPEAVTKGDDSETLGPDSKTWAVDYSRLTPLLVKAVKDLFARWTSDSEDLHRRIDSLEKDNAALKSYLCSKDPGAPICMQH